MFNDSSLFQYGIKIEITFKTKTMRIRYNTDRPLIINENVLNDTCLYGQICCGIPQNDQIMDDK